jgi:hypothetical protein
VSKRKIYHPPPLKVLYEYAQKVCQRLAEQGDRSYLKPEIITGLAMFLQVAARIEAHYLNYGEGEEARESDHKVDDQAE